MDILDLGTRRLSYRRLRSLIVRLPRESETARAIDPDQAMWPDGNYLLALIVDGIAGTNYLLRSAPHFKNPPKKPPAPIWRPGDRKGIADDGGMVARYEAVMKIIEAQTGAPRGIAPAEEVTVGD